MAETVVPGLERRLKAELTGEVMFDRFTRGRYATDASHYQVMPLGVVLPRSLAEAERTLAIARAEGVSVTARGGGTSQSGQTVNSTLIVDCSKYLDRLIEVDAAGRRCVVEPGIVLDELNRRLKPTGLWFPVDISTASRATIGGMVANNSCGARSLRYGNTRENVLSVDALLADGTAAHFGPTAPDLSDIPESSPLRALARDLLKLGARDRERPLGLGERARQHDAERHHLVVRGVGRVAPAGEAVEHDFAGQLRLEPPFQTGHQRNRHVVSLDLHIGISHKSVFDPPTGSANSLDVIGR